MSKVRKTSIEVRGTSIGIISKPEGDYISLTDMVRDFDGAGALIEQWLKNKDTVLFLGIWEQLNNTDFNSIEFEGIKNEAGRNSFFLSAKKWISLTGAIGLIASAGRYGGTYAHRDIAFEFASWISVEFKLYLIKEFQRLKDEALTHHYFTLPVEASGLACLKGNHPAPSTAKPGFCFGKGLCPFVVKNERKETAA